MRKRGGLCKIEVMAILAILAIVACILIPFVDWVAAKPNLSSALVVSKSYSGEQSGSGTAIGTNGQVAIVSTHTPERYILIVEADDWAGSCEADAGTWIKSEKGSRVILRRWMGRLFGGLQGAEVIGLVPADTPTRSVARSDR